ncbi:YcdB/YcdC domain-containing protein [Paenibacillus sp. FJAT-26967]|uniref:YcdB/YcdC domain-containing protein n=1 Tax=Paenibacillus sp. FJAT-26967 TaxID=1729690 RepID=UPI000837D5F1|nr:YcdB/YcdC domain-containing protein [Paenibacillus sp. FJAT-26967]
MKKLLQSSFRKAGLLTVTGSLGVGLLLPAETIRAQSDSVPAAAYGKEKMKAAGGEGSASQAVKNANSPELQTQVKITKDQVIARLRELFPALNKAEVVRAELGTTADSFPPEPGPIWSIQWEVKDGNSSSGFSSRVDASSGDILSLSIPGGRYSESGEPYYPGKITEQEAAEKAVAFIKKAVPSLQTSELVAADEEIYRYQQPLFGPVLYSFTYHKKVNGIQTDNESIAVQVNGNGEILSFHNNFTPDSFYPSAKPAITKEQAAGKYKEDADVDLRYTLLRKTGGKEEWILAYSPIGAYRDLDAQTGQYIQQEPSYGGAHIDYTAIPEELRTFKPLAGGKLSALEAAALVEALGVIKEEKKLMQKTEIDQWQGQKREVWSLGWGNEQSGGMGLITAVVDAKTGQILEVSNGRFLFDSNYTMPRTISNDQARDKALKLFGAVVPRAQDWKLIDRKNIAPDTEGNDKNKPFTFTFQKFYRNIPVGNQTTTITLAGDGSFYSMESSYESIDEEVLNKLKPASISREEAVVKLNQATGVELGYSVIGGYYTNSYYVPKEAKLVYRQTYAKNGDRDYVLDASTGKLRAQAVFEKLPSKPSEAADLAGHWAEKELSTLVKHGVLIPDENGKLNPDASITYGEWLNMFVRGVNPMREYYRENTGADVLFADVKKDSPYYYAVNTLIDMKRLKADEQVLLGVDTPLLREYLAKILIQQLRYDKLAGLLNSSAAELEADDAAWVTHKSEAYLAMELGLMEKTDGKFRPRDRVSKAEAAVIFMRLVSIQGKLDQPVGY